MSENYRPNRQVLTFLIACLLLGSFGCSTRSKAPDRPPTWEEQVSAIHWVTYSPSSANPNTGEEASAQAIREDIALLHRAGFTGLVTYSSAGTMGQYLPGLAEVEGFEGVILGIWDPKDEKETEQAIKAASLPIVLGYSVGNEGLGKRYTWDSLAKTIDQVRLSTNKRVATTEEVDDYSDEQLLKLGDWVFPNTHPYFHNQLEPGAAVQWTKAAYDDIVRRANRFVLLKEVGLPTAGDPGRQLSEDSQRAYYEKLEATDVRFVYFEAFDQPWKTHLPIEPHWGLFRSDRSPKALAATLLQAARPTDPAPEESVFFVFQDADSPRNHFEPSGFMGDIGDVQLDETFQPDPHSGITSIKVTYSAKGTGPNTCNYSPPCRWAGVYWQEPQGNWGKNSALADRGFDLSRYSRLAFWAKAERSTEIEFKVGGISEQYGDSLKFPRAIKAKVETAWQEFHIDLEGADLKQIIGGFVWVTSWETNPGGITFYLDDIRFVR